MNVNTQKRIEYALHTLGYRSCGSVWKKTFGFSMIIADLIEEQDSVRVRAYTMNNEDTFEFVSVCVICADFMPTKDIQTEIAFAESSLNINGKSERKRVEWAGIDPVVVDVGDFSLKQALDEGLTSCCNGIIHWQTGEPKDGGSYLIQTKYYIGSDTLLEWKEVANGRFVTKYSWRNYNSCDIIAWCKLSDIKTYKGE